MSLNWNATEVSGWDSFTDEEKNKCAHFAFELMAIGIGEVTEENIPTIMARLAFSNSLHNDETKYTIDDVRTYVGFGVNVTTETDHAWLNRVAKNRLTDLTRFWETRLNPA